MSEYSSKWKSLVGNQSMSDIIFITKDEYKIHGHILVLHVQCPDILDDIIVIEESDSNKSKKTVMWLDYSYKSCTAFLEYIYSGQESFVSPEYKEDYLHLGRRYNIPMVVDNENHELFSAAQNNISKRQSEELLNCSTTQSKRFKASSPDMFMSCVSNFDFLGPTVNDATLSALKTKHWLESCNKNQQYPSSSFTENQTTDVPLNTDLLDTNSNHSFHSAVTVSLNSYIQNTLNLTDNNKIKFNGTHTNSSSNMNKPSPQSTVSSNEKIKKTKSVPCPVITMAGMPPLTNSYKIPELIIISDSESIDTSLSNNINEHRDTLLSRTTFEKHNLPLNSNHINAIELNDDSMDAIHSINSIYSASTNILNRSNYNNKYHHSLFKNIGSSNTRNRSLINIDDGCSAFSAVTNVLSSNNNIKIIDLVDESNSSSILATDTPDLLQHFDSMTSVPAFSSNNSQDSGQNCSTSFVNVISSHISVSQENLTKNCEKFNLKNGPSKCFSFDEDRRLNIESNNSFDLDSNNFASNILSHYEENNLKPCSISPKYNNKSSIVLNTASSNVINDEGTNSSISRSNSFSSTSSNSTSINNKFKSNTSSSSEVLSIDKNDLNKPNMNSELLKSTITSMNLTLPFNNADESLVNTNKIVDLTCSLAQIMNNHTTINTTSIEIIPSQLPKCNNSTTIPNGKGYMHDKFDEGQLMWLTNNDEKPNNNDIPFISTESNSLFDERKVQTPKHNYTYYNNDINLDIETLTNHNLRSSKKKNAVTPNKYGNRINTPKSLRRVQSESVIGSKEQVTPLLDYSAMKTPDLRVSTNREILIII